MKNILFLTTLILLSSCLKEKDFSVRGKKPVYLAYSSFNKIESQEAKPFTKVGKIFIIGNRIFISDIGSGVHIIDNSDISNPTKEAFISIYGNNDMAVKGNTLYADNSKDLLAIDISDILNAKVLKRINNVYEDNRFLLFPLDYTGYFECVDTTKGVVVDWVDTNLENPECQR